MSNSTFSSNQQLSSLALDLGKFAQIDPQTIGFTLDQNAGVKAPVNHFYGPPTQTGTSGTGGQSGASVQVFVALQGTVRFSPTTQAISGNMDLQGVALDNTDITGRYTATIQGNLARKTQCGS